LDALAQVAAAAVVDQDLVVGGDDGVPIAALGETLRFCAVRQGDFGGQRRGWCGGLKTDDKQDDDGYNADNHCGGQRRHEDAQETQVSRLVARFWSIHV